MEIERDPPFQHVIDGPGQLRRQDGQRLTLAVFFLKAGQILLAHRMIAEKQDRRFGEGPRERGSADLRASGAVAVAR